MTEEQLAILDETGNLTLTFPPDAERVKQIVDQLDALDWPYTLKLVLDPETGLITCTIAWG